MDLTKFDGHTPGPWHECDHHGRRWIETAGDVAVAQIVRTGIRSETVANSALIKAAPELLAEVRRLTDEAAALRRERDELREMISAALADARREGAEVMREACEKAVWLTRLESELPDSDDKGVSGWIEVAEDRVRRSPIPMPMPAGERRAALLTDEQVAARIAQHWGSVDIAPQSVHGFARSIESAVIAANNMEVRRG